MIYLKTDDFRIAKEEHYQALKDLVLKKLKKGRLPPKLKDFVKNNLTTILKGEPRQLKNINALFYREVIGVIVTGGDVRKHDGKIKKIFDYKSFTKKMAKKYDAYDLAEKLGVSVCSYCNRMHSITVQVGKKDDEHITRPEFDHFFSQEKYPLLGLSFFNLIPSCKICNSTLKGKEKFRLKKHLHPYLDNCWNSFRFSFTPGITAGLLGVSPKNTIEVKTDKCTDLKLKKRIEKTFDIFKIKDVYNGHSEEIRELIKLRNTFSDNYLKILTNNTYPKLKGKVSEDEIYRMAFGVYRDEADFHKRPFSKLKKDILKELKII